MDDANHRRPYSHETTLQPAGSSVAATGSATRVTAYFAGGEAALLAAEAAALAAGASGTSTLAARGTWRSPDGAILMEEAHVMTIIGSEAVRAGCAAARAVFEATDELAVLLEILDLSLALGGVHEIQRDLAEVESIYSRWGGRPTTELPLPSVQNRRVELV